MPKNIKTFEEYKYFKVRSKKPGAIESPPSDSNPYWNWDETGVENTYDPNEPFRNKDKWDYWSKKREERRRNLVTKNVEITLKRICDIFKVDMNFLNEFLERNKVYLSPPYYAKTQNYWELSFNNEQRLFYFVEENDFIGEYKDSLMDKPTRKRFEKAEDYFKWWEEMKQTFNQRERIKLRRERDEMRKT